MVTRKGRVEVDQVGKPVAVSEVKVCPGDYIFGDDSGVVVITAGRPSQRVPDRYFLSQRYGFFISNEMMENRLPLSDSSDISTAAVK